MINYKLIKARNEAGRASLTASLDPRVPSKAELRAQLADAAPQHQSSPTTAFHGGEPSVATQSGN